MKNFIVTLVLIFLSELVQAQTAPNKSAEACFEHLRSFILEPNSIVDAQNHVLVETSPAGAVKVYTATSQQTVMNGNCIGSQKNNFSSEISRRITNFDPAKMKARLQAQVLKANQSIQGMSASSGTRTLLSAKIDAANAMLTALKFPLTDAMNPFNQALSNCNNVPGLEPAVNDAILKRMFDLNIGAGKNTESTGKN